MIALILLYLWAAATVCLVMWLMAPPRSWKPRDLLLMSAVWPVGPVLYLLIKWG